MVIDDLLNLSPKDIPGYLQAFADDIVSLAEGNDLDVIWDRTQKTLNTIMKWCTTKDLTISALKTKVVMFTWNKRWNLRPIVVDNTTIELSTSAKFLVITLDSKLNYNEHINNTTKKATVSLMQCRKAITNTTDIIPYLQGEAAKSNERLRAYGSLTRERPEHTKGTIKAHVTINNDFVKDLNIPHNSERDLTVPSLNLQSNFTTTTPGDNPDTYRTQLQNIINETPEDWITCYTDGSKTEEGCGTVQAITYACRQLTNYTDKHIIIWTNSLSSINSLTTLITKNKTVKYCLYILNQIGAHNQVELRWIAAHSALERADELAKHGTTSTTTIARPIPQAYINKLINDKVHKLNTDIVNKDCPRHTKLILRCNHTKIINNLNRSFINNRKDYITATQLITGHCGLNKHLYNMNKTTTKECPLCGHHEETVNHFLGQCPALAQTRGQNFNDFYLTANDIFDNIHITTIRSIMLTRQDDLRTLKTLIILELHNLGRTQFSTRPRLYPGLIPALPFWSPTSHPTPFTGAPSSFLPP
ncbi:hypothetical protein ACHWQZ_G006740 [Mnemiopsis leidyi]